MGKFKVGDKVRLGANVVYCQNATYGRGKEVGEVVGVETGSWPVRVKFPGNACLVPCAEYELELAINGQPAVCYTRKTKLQLVQIIENQKAEITKLAKEIEGLKNLKPAIAVQPVQAGQLVETVKRTRPKVGEFVNFTTNELKPGDVIYAPTVGNAKVEEFGPDPLSKSGRYEAQISYDKGSRGYACLDSTWKVVSLVDAPKIPPLDPKKAWIKKGATGRIDPSWDGHYYEFMGDPVYDQEWGYWKVPTKIIRKNGKNSDIDFVSVEFGWEPYTPEKPKTFWDLVKVGDKIKVPLMYCGKVDRTYTGRVHLVDRAGLSVRVSFIVDTVEGAPVWKPGQKASIYKGTFDLGACEILKD